MSRRFPKQKRVRLIAARKAAGLTQFKLARKAKVSTQTIFNAENGYRDPKHNTMRVILNELGIPFSDWRIYFDLER